MSKKLLKGRRDYEVGYGKPPISSRFKKGECGNRKGRPKGVKNAATILEERLNRMIEIRENGKSRKITALEGILAKTINVALTGNLKATELVMKRYASDEIGRGPAERAPKITEDMTDEQAMAAYLYMARHPGMLQED